MSIHCEVIWNILMSSNFLNTLYTPILKNHVNGCHGNLAFFHSAFEFIFGDIFVCISGVSVNDWHP